MHVCLIFWRPDSLDMTASSPLDRPDISNTSAVPTTAPLRAALMQLYAATVLASLPFHCIVLPLWAIMSQVLAGAHCSSASNGQPLPFVLLLTCAVHLLN